MKIGTLLLKYYIIGVIIALLLIGIIHLYSLIAETYFSYAEWNNILLTAMISGLPFGVALWAFATLKLQNDTKTKYNCKANRQRIQILG